MTMNKHLNQGKIAINNGHCTECVCYTFRLLIQTYLMIDNDMPNIDCFIRLFEKLKNHFLKVKKVSL